MDCGNTYDEPMFMSVGWNVKYSEFWRVGICLAGSQWFSRRMSIFVAESAGFLRACRTRQVGRYVRYRLVVTAHRRWCFT